MDASMALGRLYNVVLAAKDGTITGDIGGISTTVKVIEDPMVRWEVLLSPLSIPTEEGRMVLWKWVRERGSRIRRYVEQSPETVIWDSWLLRGYSETIQVARAYPPDIWGLGVSDGDRDIHTIEPGSVFPQGLSKVIDHRARRVYVGVVIPVLVPIEYERGRVEVNLRIEYQHVFSSSLDRASREIVETIIGFKGFDR